MGTNKELFIRLLCEFFGSFFVQFFGCVFSQFSGTIAHALTWGCAVVAATHTFRIISGAHINPCITIAAMILEVVIAAEGFLYICFQMIGSAVGFGVAYGILDGTVYRGKNFCVAVIALTPWWKSLLLEIFMTGAWVLAMCASWQRENINLLETVSLRIGLVVALCHLVGVSNAMLSYVIIFPREEYLYVGLDM